MSQGTGMQPAADETDRAPGPAGVRRWGAVVYDWLHDDVFRRTDSGPVGWRKIVAAVVLFAVAMAVSLSRTKGPGSLDTIWIEDAKFLLSQSLNMPAWSAISSPISSYYQEPARLITAFAIHFPLTWVPGIMALFSAAEYAMYGLVAYIASGPYLRSPWLRLLLAAPVCCIPLAYTQVNNDLVTVQFFGLFGAFWTCLWLPGTRAGKIISVLVMATVSWTAVLSIGLFPLVIARLVVDRSKTAWALAVVWASGVYLQMSETISGQSHHQSFGSNSLVFVLHNYVSRVVPRALFGERSLGGSGVDYTGRLAPLHVTNPTAHHALIICAWLIVLLVIALAATRFTDPNWTLAVVAGVFSVGFFLEEMLINTGVVQTRYVIAPALLLYTALIALLRPRQPEGVTAGRAGGWLPDGPLTAGRVVRWLPAFGFALLLLVAVTLNFRVTNGRTTSPPWTRVVAEATSACAHPGVKAYTYVHEWWWVTIPCDRVR